MAATLRELRGRIRSAGSIKKITKAQEMDAEKAKMVAKAELTTTLMERVRRSALLAELCMNQQRNSICHIHHPE